LKRESSFWDRKKIKTRIQLGETVV